MEFVHKTKWLSLCKIKDPGTGNDYIYSHESRCNGIIYSIVPYRINDNDLIEFCLIQQMTPCWGPEYPLTSITGGFEGGEYRKEVLKEIEEELGYSNLKEDNLIFLGKTRSVKSSDSTYLHYSIDLSYMKNNPNKRQWKEENIKDISWLTFFEVLQLCRDPFVFFAMNRILGNKAAYKVYI